MSIRLIPARTGAGRRTLALAWLLSLAGWATAAPPSLNDGVFTATQAQQGAEAHMKYCANCHHQSYYEAGFLDAWYGTQGDLLYDAIRMKMPVDRPGALRPREYLALVAWIFALNGFPAGTEPLSTASLERLSITRRAP
jgi:mono/diheme cytochrome c family protein